MPQMRLIQVDAVRFMMWDNFGLQQAPKGTPKPKIFIAIMKQIQVRISD